MRAVIYTQRVEIVDAYEERRDCADQRIADFIRECGFLPLPLPNKRELAAEMCGVFTGSAEFPQNS